MLLILAHLTMKRNPLNPLGDRLDAGPAPSANDSHGKLLANAWRCCVAGASLNRLRSGLWVVERAQY
jgi:hypothetical protein